MIDNIKQIMELLEQNAIWTQEALAEKNFDDLHRFMIQRTELKNLLLEMLLTEKEPWLKKSA